MAQLRVTQRPPPQSLVHRRRRQAALVQVAQAIAQRPFSLDAAAGMADTRRTAVEQLEHRELFLEAVCTAVLFEVVTKLADATGRPTKTPAVRMAMKCILTIMGVLYGIYCWLRRRLVFGSRRRRAR